jgi:hypothetical protein
VYWAVTGSTTPIGELLGMGESEWQQTNWAASLVLIGAAVFSLALVQRWGRRLPRGVLLGTAWVGAVVAILHWVAFSVQILLNMTGVTDGEVTTFHRWNLFVLEPWFLGMGVLLGVAAAQNSRDARAAAVDAPPAVPRSPAAVASVAVALFGLLVILGGVMAFNVWVYAVVGPIILAVGLLGSLATKRVRRIELT